MALPDCRLNASVCFQRLSISVRLFQLQTGHDPEQHAALPLPCGMGKPAAPKRATGSQFLLGRCFTCSQAA
jgi:hypothetical protein